MSYSFTKANSQYFQGSIPAGFRPTGGATIAICVKIPSLGAAYHQLVSVNTGSQGSIYITMQNNGVPFGRIVNDSGSGSNAVSPGGGTGINSNWHVYVYTFDNPADIEKLFWTNSGGDLTGTQPSTNNYADYWLGQDLATISVGGPSNPLDGKVAYFALYPSPLTNTQASNLVSGKHPADTTNVGSPAILFDWINGSSLTSTGSVSGVTLTGYGTGNPTYDSGDNPSFVESPPVANVALGSVSFQSSATTSLSANLWPTQVVRPVSDVSTGAWISSLGGTLSSMLDEVVADDNDYISTQSSSTCRIRLGTLSNPGSDPNPVRLNYRIKGDGSSNLTVKLYSGANLISTYNHSPAPATFTTYTQTLSQGERAAISDWGLLELEFTVT